MENVVAAVRVGADSVAILRQELYPRKLTRIVINGPVDSEAVVYVGAMVPSARVDRTSRGESNSNDYSNPIPIPPGAEAYIVWPGTGSLFAQASATFVWERAR